MGKTCRMFGVTKNGEFLPYMGAFGMAYRARRTVPSYCLSASEYERLSPCERWEAAKRLGYRIVPVTVTAP